MKYLVSSILFVLTSLMLVSCATPYQPSGLGGGYSDLQLSKNIYKVSFRGNGFTSFDRVQNLLLYRCADLTYHHGYKYFVILNSNIRRRDSSFATPTRINSSTYGSVNGYGTAYPAGLGGANYSMYGNYQGNTNTTINPGHVYHIHKYENAVVMKMLRSNKRASRAFNAKMILKSLAKEVTGVHFKFD